MIEPSYSAALQIVKPQTIVNAGRIPPVDWKTVLSES